MSAFLRSPSGAEHGHPALAAPSAGAWRQTLDARLFDLFGSKSLRRMLRDHDKLNLTHLSERAESEWITSGDRITVGPSMDALAVHERLVEGLPGQALFISAALAFDSLGEALPYFDVTRKTAWKKLEGQLSRVESEQALRLGRVAKLAAEFLGTQDAARSYLRTANFALGGAAPLDLLKTAEGEQLVLAELQAQADGGPV